MADEMDSLGGKRKYAENPLTAKAETGSLKIKISRKGEGAQNANLFLSRLKGDSGSMYGAPAAPRSPSTQPVQPIQSPPKPRPNRKHVPIFYQRPNAFDVSITSSTDEIAVQSTSVTSVTSEYDAVAQISSTASTSSATGHFARMDLTSVTSLGPMPLSNPLFTRGMSETSGSLTDLLKTVLPSVHSIQTGGSSYDYGIATGSSTHSMADQMTMSQHSLMNPAAALRQLASSSPAYARMDSDPYQHQRPRPHHQQLQHQPQHQELHQEQHHEQHQEKHQEKHQEQHQEQQHHQPRQHHYQFDAMSALQNAVKMAVATASPTTTTTTSHSHNQSHLSFGNTPPHNDHHDLGPPPGGPPRLGIEHSLMGGGIEAQPVIANVNTVNFDWNKYHQEGGTVARPRSGSLPNVLEEDDSSGPSAVRRRNEV